MSTTVTSAPAAPVSPTPTLPPISLEKNGSTFNLVFTEGSKLEKGVVYYGLNLAGPPDAKGEPTEVLPPIQDLINLLGLDLATRLLLSRSKKGLKEIYEEALDANNGVFDDKTYIATFNAYTFVIESIKTLEAKVSALLDSFMSDQLGQDPTQPVSATNPVIDMDGFKKLMKAAKAKVDARKRDPNTTPDNEPNDAPSGAGNVVAG